MAALYYAACFFFVALAFDEATTIARVDVGHETLNIVRNLGVFEDSRVLSLVGGAFSRPSVDDTDITLIFPPSAINTTPAPIIAPNSVPILPKCRRSKANRPSSQSEKVWVYRHRFHLPEAMQSTAQARTTNRLDKNRKWAMARQRTRPGQAADRVQIKLSDFPTEAGEYANSNRSGREQHKPEETTI